MDWNTIRTGKPASRPDLPITQPHRIVWRLSRRQQTITAGLFTHPGGTELRVYVEPLDADDLLHSEVQRFDLETLDTRAADLREVLSQQGWTPVTET